MKCARGLTLWLFLLSFKQNKRAWGLTPSRKVVHPVIPRKHGHGKGALVRDMVKVTMAVPQGVKGSLMPLERRGLREEVKEVLGPGPKGVTHPERVLVGSRRVAIFPRARREAPVQARGIQRGDLKVGAKVHVLTVGNTGTLQPSAQTPGFTHKEEVKESSRATVILVGSGAIQVRGVQIWVLGVLRSPKEQARTLQTKLRSQFKVNNREVLREIHLVNLGLSVRLRGQ